jgi:hypothetical protein
MKKLVVITLAILLIADAASVTADIQQESAAAPIQQMIDGGPPM